MTIRKIHPDKRVFPSHQRWKQLSAWLIDFVFPPKCGGCGRVDFRFCESCLDDLQAVPVAIKPRSAKGINGLCAAGLYEAKLKQAIRAFKYNGAVELAPPLADRLVTALERRNWSFDIIVPVPLSAERLEERGYNQADLLGQQVAEQMNIPYRTDELRRIRHTAQQTKLPVRQRVENVKNAFAATAKLARRSVLLIDDVVTTGSTLEACADALRTAEVKAVYAIAVAASA